MGKNKKMRKNKLFSLYAKSLSIYRPEYNDQFLCPICKKKFDRDELDLLACAHVFPEKLGGKLRTLSCAECDNDIGSEFNWHAAEEKKVRIWQEGPKKGRFIPESGLSAYIVSVWDLEKSIISIYPPSEMPLGIWKKWIEDIRANSPDGGPYKFSIEQKEPTFVPTRRDISHIHSAFLMMFYQFGYEYVLSPNAEPIRQMFNGSNMSWKPSVLVRPLRNFTESHGRHLDLPLVGIVVEPKELCSFAVFLPSLNNRDYSSTVFLPGFGTNAWDFYEYLEQNRTPNLNIKVVYPTQINIQHPNNNGDTIGPCSIQIDINNANSKGCAEMLYQTFTQLNESDFSNMDVHITISKKLEHNNNMSN